MNALTQRLASFSFALVTTLSILSGIFTLAAHEQQRATVQMAQAAHQAPRV